MKKHVPQSLNYRKPYSPAGKMLPLVSKLFREAEQQKVPLSTIALRTGLALSTIRGWRHGGNPTLGNIDACFGVLGMRLAIRKADQSWLD